MEQLIKILKMLTSSHDGEKLAAVEAVHRWMKQHGKTWEQLLGRQVDDAAWTQLRTLQRRLTEMQTAVNFAYSERDAARSALWSAEREIRHLKAQLKDLKAQLKARPNDPVEATIREMNNPYRPETVFMEAPFDRYSNRGPWHGQEFYWNKSEQQKRTPEPPQWAFSADPVREEAVCAAWRAFAGRVLEGIEAEWPAGKMPLHPTTVEQIKAAAIRTFHGSGRVNLTDATRLAGWWRYRHGEDAMAAVPDMPSRG